MESPDLADIRVEGADDLPAIRSVHLAAFPGPGEARLVDELRNAGKLLLSMVAEQQGEIVGHVAFSPVSIAGEPCGVGLAPVAVLPKWQRRGIGTQLIRTAIEVIRAASHGFIVVLGEPGYYQRFGFCPAGRWGLANEYGAGDEFQALELRAGAIAPGGGLVRYSAEFAQLA